MPWLLSRKFNGKSLGRELILTLEEQKLFHISTFFAIKESQLE
jgi:hypothetical protein